MQFFYGLATWSCIVLTATALGADEKAPAKKPSKPSEPKAPVAMMIRPGKILLKTDFANPKDLTGKKFGTRKSTRHHVIDGTLKLIPPKLTTGDDKPKANDKWAKSTMARINFKQIPQDYACRFRFKLNAPKDEKSAKRASLFCEFGHRYVRIHTSVTGSQLLLMNHLLEGKDPDTRSPKQIKENQAFKIAFDRWYWFYGEIKNDEVLIRIGDQKFYGRDAEIKKKRPEIFQLNNSGAGFLMDDLTIWEAGEFKADWKKRREALLGEKAN
jgi:hypothetical protein